MTDLRTLALAAALGGFSTVLAQAAMPATPQPFKIGYVELAKDPRYANEGAFAGIQFHDVGRPYPGALLGLDDALSIGKIIKVDFGIEKSTGDTVDALAATVDQWVAQQQIHFVLTDLSSADLKALSAKEAGKDVVFLNVSEADDALRGADCKPNLFHTAASYAMLSDALVQYLAVHKWRDILVLKGPSPQDAASVAALERSTKKFGARIVEERNMELTNDPRNREESNVALMTGNADYDVVYIADSSNEVGRYIPYQTLLPRPVVGSAGLVPTEWTWSWDRDAAAQLQHRFEKLAPPRRMNGADFAAWAAIKALTQAVLRSKSVDFAKVRDFLTSDKLNVDTVKGNPASFRSWDHQLRQPILLATPNAVIDRAPLPEFLHQTNVLDTLGVDQPETACHL